MGSFVNRPTTSKQRHRQAAKRSKLRQNAKEKHSASKRGFLKHQGGKKKNRVDKRALTEKSTRTAVELLAEVKTGKVKLSGDSLDARALADLLKAEGPSGKKTLASDKLSAVPQNEGLDRLNAALDRELDAAQVPAPKKNSNQYARRGPSYNFWDRMGLHPLIMAALKEMAFTHPTPIQAETLPSVLASSHNDRNPDHRREDFRKDFVVSAETGSGKTLVFALPVIQSILASKADQIAAAQTVANVETAVPARTSLARARGGKSARPTEDKELEEMDAKEEEEEAEENEEGEEEQDQHDEEAAGEEDEEGDEEEDEADDEEHDGEDHGDDEGLEEVEVDHDESVRAAFVNATKVLHTLVLSPTRELAQQIHDAMKKLTSKCREFVHVASIVGGMAPSKQQRILNRMPDVLICTPGRLWDLVKKNEGAFLGHSISRRLQYVVLDEADRLVESNRFEELKNILERVRCPTLPHGVMEVADDEEVHETLTAGAWDPIKKEFVPVQQPKRTRKDEPRPMRFPPEPPLDHRTTFFVTSATLSLQVNFQNKNAGEKKILRTKNASTMHIVMKDLGINEKSARVFDLAPDANVVARLQETYLRCPEGSKELYLYYFLQQYCKTGRTVVFVNAISMLRRIVKIFEILRVPIAGLHASMQQRQRLKIIDKFRAGERSVLVATDVAARGLDIEGVKYVVHFQLARSTDTYIHRCGRTARCGSEGFSCVFVHPDEFHPYQQLMHSMGRSAKLEVFSLDQSIVRKLYPHLQLALEIDKLARGARKTHADQGWVARAAQEADLDAEDMIDDSAAAKNREQIKIAKTLRKRLDAMLKQDVGAKGAYLTSPRALGAAQAVADVHRRATRQIRMHRTE